MIREPTLFVVGAGASKELHFPLGGDLLGMLADLFKVERDTMGHWVGSQPFIELAQAFERRFSVDHNLVLEKARFVRSKILGTSKSIDQLIDTYSGDDLFEKVAKLGIAKVIAEAEARYLPRLSDGFRMSDQPWNQNNWLHTFCGHYFAGIRSNGVESLFEDVSFVCFNYDRCLEYGLMRAAAHHFNLSDEQALLLPDRLKVVHPYGSLGKLPNSRAALNAIFENGQRHTNIVEMATNIRTFTEGTETENISQKISEFISGARRIVCLGFGYNAANVSLFINPDGSVHKQIYGTTLDMKAPNALAAQNQLCQQLMCGFQGQKFSALRATDLLDEYELELFK